MSIQAKIISHPILAKRFAWLVCALGGLFYCYEYFLRITPSVMMPQLMQAFNIDATSFGTLIGLYYFAYTFMQLPVGITMDRYGPRRLLIFAALVCSFGVFLFNSPNHIIIAGFGRLLIGFGSAFAFVGVLKLATMWLPPKRFALVTGLTLTLAMLGAMLSDVLVAHFVEISGWQTTIKFSILMGLVLAGIIGLVIPDQPSEFVRQTDQQAKTYRELLRDTWQLLKNPVIWLNGLLGCFLYMSLSVFGEAWGPQYLNVTHHMTAQQSANITTAIFLAWAIGSPIMGAMATNLKRTLRILLVASILTTIFSAMMLYLTSIHGLMLYSLIFLFAFASSAQILVFPLAQSLVSNETSGTAIAITNLLVMLGGVVFQPLVGKLLDRNWDGVMSNGVRVYSPHAFTVGLSMLTMGAAVSVVLVLIIKYRLEKPSLAATLVQPA